MAVQCNRSGYNSPAWRPVALSLLSDSKLRSLRLQMITSENAFPKPGALQTVYFPASFQYVWDDPSAPRPAAHIFQSSSTGFLMRPNDTGDGYPTAKVGLFVNMSKKNLKKM